MLEVEELKLPDNLELLCLDSLTNAKGLNLVNDCGYSFKGLPLEEAEKLLERCDKEGVVDLIFEFTLSQEDKDRLNEKYLYFTIL